MDSRPASVTDLERLALAMPEATREPAAGGLPVFTVRGRSFVFHRPPRKDAVDERGERLTDVICFRCSGPEDKLSILGERDTAFFTTPHFDGYNAVLLRASRIGEVRVGVLAEVVADAWLATAPKRLAAAWLASPTRAR